MALTAYRIVWIMLLPAALSAAVADQLSVWSPTRALEVIALLGTSAILFRRRGADTIAAMLALAFLLWVITASSAWSGISAVPLLAVLDRIRFLLFVTAMMLFPSGRFDPSWTRIGASAILVAFGLGIAEALRLVPAGSHILPTMVCAALAVVAMRARLISLPPGVQRQQIKWVALGLAAGLCFVALSRLGTFVLRAQPSTSPLGEILIGATFDLGVTLMVLGVLTSLLRFRLYDADAAISRSSAIALLTLILIGVFAGAEVVIQAASQKVFGEMAGTISSAAAAAVAATLIAPLHGWVTTWAERRFQPALATFRREMPDLLADLRETADLQLLGEILLARTERATRTSRAVLLVGGEPVAARHMKFSETDRAHSGSQGDGAPFALEVPLELQGTGRVGCLLIGPRPDGSLLGKDERATIEEVARPLARAIRAVQQNEAEERRRRNQAQRIIELSRRMEALERPIRAAVQ